MTTLRQHSSQCTCNVTLVPEKPTYSDSSGAIFSMYIDKGQKFDKENADNWDGQANGILLFVCSCSLPISLNIFFLRLSSLSLSSQVSSPPPWLLLLLSATRTCSKILVPSCPHQDVAENVFGFSRVYPGFRVIGNPGTGNPETGVFGGFRS